MDKVGLWETIRADPGAPMVRRAVIVEGGSRLGWLYQVSCANTPEADSSHRVMLMETMPWHPPVFVPAR
jgi:hypothetical protein